MRHRLSHLLSETPIFFFAVVLGVALVFKLAIGWAKTPTTLSEDPAARPISTSSPAAATPTSASTSISTTTASAPALATVEPVPSVPAPPMLPRRKPRPRR